MKTNDEKAVTANKTADKGKSCDHARKKSSQTVSAGKKNCENKNECDNKNKSSSKKLSAPFCTGEDCEYCEGKEGRVSDRHLQKLVDDTLATLDRPNENVNRKELRSKLQTLHRHLKMKQKQLASKDDAGKK